MLISVCIPCHNRTYDLKKTMPSMIEAANNSPPVEITVIDYNSQDDLRDFFFETYGNTALVEGNFLTYKRYGARKHYHMAHARNLSVLASSGEYVVLGDTDTMFAETYFEEIRELLSSGDIVWMIATQQKGKIVCKRDEFIEAGGYDERFEFYGPEDNDLVERLYRRGGKFASYSGELLTTIRTPWKDKLKNYRVTSRREIKNRMKPIYLENQKNEVWIVNEEEGWGSWE